MIKLIQLLNDQHQDGMLDFKSGERQRLFYFKMERQLVTMFKVALAEEC